MFQVLIESSGRRVQPESRWTLGSAVIHAALVTGAIALTATAPQVSNPEPIPTDPPIYVAPAQPIAPADAGARHGLPAPKAPAPLDISVPSVPTFEPALPFTQGTVPGADPFARSIPATSVPVAAPTAGIHTREHVDRVVVPDPRNPAPDYPDGLRAAGVAGEVLVTFVVDTVGRVEEESVRVLTATHSQFADAVLRWLRRTRYTAAEIGGVRVRQLVQQRVDFTLH